MKFSFKTILTHILVLGFFIVAALAYFYPVLQGKALYQSDIAQYKGMAQERNEFKETTGQESYWTNSAFGGMPTYQLGANYPHDYVKKLDRLIRFLPRPADYLFLYFIGFYILMLCMKVEYRLAILGALAFGFSTYLIIILGVGHNAKAHALGYIPMVLGGILLVFRKKYLAGFLLTAIAMALEISANHYQMTYYFMLLVLVLGLVYLVYAIKNQQLKHFLTSVGILVMAVVLGIATNATGLMATKEYADWSTRGKSDLTIDYQGNPKADVVGLDKEYITQYSYGITETFNLFVPRLFGGSNAEDLGKDSNTYEFLLQQGISPSTAMEFAEGLPLYWGDQPIVAGPAYLGAMVFFLFILGVFLVKGKRKWWLLGTAIVALVLSWGKNFDVITNFMIDYFPLYNKFRAVSSIQVLIELCVPILAILGLKAFVSSKKTTPSEKWKALKYTTCITIGLGVALFLIKGTFGFEGPNDGRFAQAYGEQIMAMIERDRMDVYVNDTIRSLVFVILTALALYLYYKGKITKTILSLGLGVLLILDLGGVAKRYVDKDDFVRQRAVDQPYQMTAVDKEILKDQSVFRVFDPQEGLNGARSSYFHKSLGGYHAAKPQKMQDLVEFHLYQNNLQVLNMLNVKYIVQQDEEGNRYPGLNPDANGNAWFVDSLRTVTTANEEILALNDLDTKTTAVVNTTSYPKLTRKVFQVDSTASISLVDHRPNFIEYRYNNPNSGFAVFSEMHYPRGWVATVDGRETPIIKVNYALRGMSLPAGQHTIKFKFAPEVVATGSKIALGSNILLGIVLLGGVITAFIRPKQKRKKD